jgi:acetyltransferase-like isoleucine patch superfamily enzyme
VLKQFFPNHSLIEAGTISLGEKTSIGKNVCIRIRGEFRLGDFSRIGDNVQIQGEEVLIGRHFYHTDGLVIGGGGSQFFYAKLTIGDRCVMHNNYINLCRPVVIGNDVGFSPDVQIITHGFWNSVLEGYPVRYDSVHIGEGVIIGQRSMILMGVQIAKNCVVGAQSVVSKSLRKEKCIYAGNPAKLIREIETPPIIVQIDLLDKLLGEYRKFISHYYSPPKIEMDFPKVHIEEFYLNVATGESYGEESKTTDDFRDYLRRYGIRVYTERPFGGLML